jgi:D-alanine-D-alanine ligase
VLSRLGATVFVKPANMGSSIGISRATGDDELLAALREAFRHDDVVVVEEALDVRELETAVLGPANGLRVSLVGEIVPAAEFYDFDDKYRDGAARTVVPADLPHDLAEQARSLAIRAAWALRVEGMARVDLFLAEGRGLLVNEVNTIPGFTPISMYPVLWEASGVGYSALLDELVALALARHAARSARG